MVAAPTALNKAGKALDQTWELALQMALDDFQNPLLKARAVTFALVRSLSIPGGFDTLPPAHVSVFRSAGIEKRVVGLPPRLLGAREKICESELGLAFRQEKSLRQACQDIDAQCNAIMTRST